MSPLQVSETPEIYSAEHLLTRRAASRAAASTAKASEQTARRASNRRGR